MDCPSEEQMIRMKLASLEGIAQLEFDLEGRKLAVYHQGVESAIEAQLAALKLGSKLVGTEKVAEAPEAREQKQDRRLLKAVLVINFSFFAIEMAAAWWARSMGLMADSLDMLADALVYGISLWAVGRSLGDQKKVARLAGYSQVILAILGLSEVLRRFFFAEALPDFQTMLVVSGLALLANAASLWILQRSQNKEQAHLKASMIFTSNDIIINLGVMLAAGAVYWSGSMLPDLIIGGIVFLIVSRGAYRILKLA